MKYKVANLLASLLIFCTASSQETLHYITRNDTTQLYLDFYRPQQPRADRACVVYLFGGGFYEGERNNSFMVKSCKALAERGFAVAAIDYRLGLREADLSGANLFNAHKYFEYSASIAVQDCSAAIAYLCEHAAELGIDTAHIVLSGNSAGAITVLQTDFCRANQMADAAELPISFCPLAVVSYAGAVMCNTGKIRYAIPPAPTCFFHGTKDRIVNYKYLVTSTKTSLYGSDRLARYFKQHNYDYTIRRYDGIGHEVASIMPLTIDYFEAFVNTVSEGRHTTVDAHCTDAQVQPTKWTTMNLIDLYLRPNN